MHVGIDYDSNTLYVCCYRTSRTNGVQDDPTIAAIDLRNRQGDQTEAILAVPSALAFAAQRLNVVTGTPAWVERGHGPNRNADWILGAIAGAILASWPRITGGGAARLITTADWKKTIGAPGNAPKNVANHWTTLQWRSRHPGAPIPTNHNHLDAYAIAVTGSLR